MGIGKAEQENLQIHYEELEDYEGKDVTIIARLDSRRYYKDKPLVVFDIYKDFLGFNSLETIYLYFSILFIIFFF